MRARFRLRQRPKWWSHLFPPLAACLLFSLFVSPELADLSGDSARYLLLAEALATGQGYVEISKPDHPPHTEYAPGLPLLLAPLLRLFPPRALANPVSGTPLLLAKLVPGLALILSALLLSLLALSTRAVNDRISASLLALILATLPFPARFANQVLSDLPYLTASLVVLYYLYSLLNSEGETRAVSWLGAGLLIALSFFFRQLGIALWLAATLGVLLPKEKSIEGRGKVAILISIGFWVPVLVWLIRNYLVAGAVDAAHFSKLFMVDGNPFAGSLPASAIISRAVHGVSDYFRETGALLVDMAGQSWPRGIKYFLAFLVSLPVLIGLFSRLVQKRGPLEWYFLFYFVLISVWQSHNPRYLLPLLPLGLIFAAKGLEVLGSGARLLFATAVIFLGFNFLILALDLRVVRKAPITPVRTEESKGEEKEHLLLSLSGPLHWGRWYQFPDFLRSPDPAAMATRYHHLLGAGLWMKRHLPATAVIVTRKPPLLAYVSGHHCLQYPPQPQAEKFLSDLRELGATHVLVDEVSPEVRLFFQEVLLQKPQNFQPLFSLGATVIYQVQYEKE